jgi:hypothetical protein
MLWRWCVPHLFFAIPQVTKAGHLDPYRDPKRKLLEPQEKRQRFQGPGGAVSPTKRWRGSTVFTHPLQEAVLFISFYFFSASN